MKWRCNSLILWTLDNIVSELTFAFEKNLTYNEKDLHINIGYTEYTECINCGDVAECTVYICWPVYVCVCVYEPKLNREEYDFTVTALCIIEGEWNIVCGRVNFGCISKSSHVKPPSAAPTPVKPRHPKPSPIV